MNNIIHYNNLKFLFGLSWYDMKSRYARTRLGNIWPSLVMLITSTLLAYVYAYSFEMSKGIVFKYIISGYPLWILTSSCIMDSTQAFKTSSSYIRNLALPSYIWIFRVLLRNIITYAHNIALTVLVFVFFFSEINIFNFLLFQIIAFFLILLLLVPIAVITGIICLFFEALISLVANSITFLMFASPIFIGIDGIRKIPYLEFNPITAILNYAHQGVNIYDSEISFIPYLLFLITAIMISTFLYKKKHKLIPLML